MTAALITQASRRAEFRHGWRPLVGSTIGLGFGIASIPLYTNSIFFATLQSKFGWTASSLSVVFLICNLLLAVLAPVCGSIVDRFGHRKPAVVSGLILAGSYLVLAIAPDNFALYACTQVAVYIGAGCSSAIAHARSVSGSFSRMRGLALGIMNTGPAIVAIFIPTLLSATLDGAGLAGGYLLVGGLVAVASIVVFAITPRRRASSAAPAADTGTRIGFAQLLRNGVLIRLLVAYFLLGLATIGLIEHLFSLLLTAGVAEGDVLWMLGGLGSAMLVIRLVVGALLDAFPSNRVAAAVLALAAVGISSLAFAGPAAAAVATFSLGLALGAETDIMVMLVSRYFPLARFGQVFGLGSLVFGLGVAVGPLVVALAMENAPSVAPPVLVAAALLAIVAVVFASLPTPRTQATDRAETRDHAAAELP